MTDDQRAMQQSTELSEELGWWVRHTNNDLTPVLERAAEEIVNLRIRIARLEGYSAGLAERLRQVRRAAGCDHE